jgi:hypothetical protein
MLVQDSAAKTLKRRKKIKAKWRNPCTIPFKYCIDSPLRFLVTALIEASYFGIAITGPGSLPAPVEMTW